MVLDMPLVQELNFHLCIHKLNHYFRIIKKPGTLIAIILIEININLQHWRRLYMLYVNGEWRKAKSCKVLSVTNPATKEEITEVASGNAEDTKEAIDTAAAVFPSWKKKTGKERGEYLRKAADKLRGKVDELAKTITEEMGKPLHEAKGEIGLAIDYMDWYAEEAKRVYGDTLPASHEDKRLMVIKQPVGVVAAVTPWNFPVAMITRKIAPALAAGCPVVIKPASATPVSAIKVIEAFHEAEFPKGVVNLIIGSAREVVGEMTRNPDVRKLTFTGSTEVGKELIRQSADTVKKVSMELGGHAPFLVFEDADIDAAVDSAIASKFRNAGQTCICTNRIYVQESIAREFGEKLSAKVADMKIGNGLEDGVAIGPLIDGGAVEKTAEHVRDAVKHGGKVLCGGNEANTGLDGYFYEPTVITDANENMKISYEETFGPVAPIFTFKTEEEAIEKANNTEYGLAAYVFTENLSRVYHVMEELEYGIVGINDPAPTVAQSPFGGLKESGLGREGGKYGIAEYLEEKYISIQLKN